MHRTLLVLAFAVLQLFRGLPPTEDQFFVLFRDYLESLRTQAHIPGLSAAIVGESDVVWERSFGYEDLERSKQTLTATPFHFDGLTQIFTAAAVLRCVEDGR